MDPKVTVIVVSWNGKKYLDDCFRTIFDQTYGNYDTIMVDNGSTDGSVELARKNYGRLKIIALDKNYGFAEGNNVAIKEAMCDRNVIYVLLLNVDTRIERTFIEELVKAAEQDEHIGSCQPKMLSLINPGVIDAAGITFRKDGDAVQIGFRVNDSAKYNVPKELFGVCAGAALYRRSMLEEIGLFDEDFFAYYEDADLVMRSRLAGWRSMYVPAAVVHHYHSYAFGDQSPLKIYYLERNRYYYVTKTMPPGIAIRFLITRPILLGNFCIGLILKNQAKSALNYLKANIAGYIGVPAMYSKRRAIKRMQKIDDADLIKWFV